MKAILFWLFLATQILGYSIFESKQSIDQRHLDVIHAIKDVVITTQKTRGLTNNYMNGNVVAQLLVYGQRKQMQHDFSTIEKALKQV